MSRRLIRQLEGGGLIPIHQGKMSRYLRAELSRRRLSKYGHDWIAVPEHIAGIYMGCLAAEMGQAIRAPLITDVAEIAPGEECILFGEPSRTQRPTDMSSVLLKLGIRLPRPEALAGVSMRRVLRFHRQHADERIAFREKVAEIVDAVSELNDPAALEDNLASNRRQIESALRDHRKLISELKVKSFTAFLKLGCPVAVAAAACKVSDLIDPRVISITGLAIAMVTWWADVRGQSRAAVRSCPWHYTVEVNRKFCA
jgi:DNA-binding transcriptional ArsR family regulator